MTLELDQQTQKKALKHIAASVYGCNAEFEYIVTKKERSKVAFLSGQARKTGQELTYSKIDEILIPPNDSLGPGTYDSHKCVTALSSNKVVSKLGVGGLARKGPRIKCAEVLDTPGPGHYYKPPTYSCKRGKYPFDSNTPRKDPFVANLTSPGVCAYDTTRPRKRVIPQAHSFGGRVKLKPIVTFKCTPYNRDICSICSEKPIGDYWITNDSNKSPICSKCYDIRDLSRDISVIPNKSKYKKIRDCTNTHQHEGTTATIPLITERERRKQEVREAYLHNYDPTRVIKQIKPPTKKPKPIRKDIKIDDTASDGITKDMAKFIDSFYKRTDAEYLEQRDISDERMREIFIPSRVVPNMDQLMQHLLAEPETYQFRDPPKGRKMPLQLPEEEIEYEYEYQPVEYTLHDILDDPEIIKRLEQQDWMKIVRCKTPGVDSDSEMETETEMSEQQHAESAEEGEEMGDELAETEREGEHESESNVTTTAKEPSITEMVAKIDSLRELDGHLLAVETDISNVVAKISGSLEEYSLEAKTTSRHGLSESVEYGLRMIQKLFEPEPVYEVEARAEQSVQEITESKPEEKVASSQSELELLQDPNIPPMPRAVDKHYEELDREEVDEDVRSLLEDSDIASLDSRSLSQMTIGTFPGYPSLKP